MQLGVWRSQGPWKAERALCLQLPSPLPPYILTNLLSTPNLWDSQVRSGTNKHPRDLMHMEI